MKFDTSNTFKEVGFLSPEIKPIIADLRKLHATWFVFAEDVNRTGQRILGVPTIGLSGGSRRCGDRSADADPV